MATTVHGVHHAHERIGWHVHSAPYAAIVLEGGYLEAGDSGRFNVQSGQVLFHQALEGHWDEFGSCRSRILNLPFPPARDGNCNDSKLWQVADPDAVARRAEHDLADAAELLAENITPLDASPTDWPDLLAQALRVDTTLEIGAWAEREGLAPATVSRGFRRAFGVSPAHYRRRQRCLAAAMALRHSAEPLVVIAASYCFTDQAHMTHELRWLTGTTPAAWRKSGVKPLQDH